MVTIEHPTDKKYFSTEKELAQNKNRKKYFYGSSFLWEILYKKSSIKLNIIIFFIQKFFFIFQHSVHNNQ